MNKHQMPQTRMEMLKLWASRKPAKVVNLDADGLVAKRLEGEAPTHEQAPKVHEVGQQERADLQAAKLPTSDVAKLARKYPTRKFNDLSKKQVDAARKFADQYNTTVSQAAKYIEVCFAVRNGEINADELRALTGWKF